MKITKKLMIILLSIFIAQIFINCFQVESRANTTISKINVLNNNSEKVDSHEEDTSNSRLEVNAREVIELKRENLDSANEDLDNIVYPRLKKMKKKTDNGYEYILTFQNTSSDINNNGINIYYTRSSDLINWEQPKKLYENNINNSDNWHYSSCDLFVLDDGRLMSVASKYLIRTYNWIPSKFNNCGIYVKYSKDNGDTWTEEQQIYSGMCWEPSILQLNSGEIQVYFTQISPVEYLNGNGSYIARSSIHFQSSGTAMLSSIDNGETWSPNVEGTDQNYNGEGRNPYSAYRVAQQPVKNNTTNEIVDFTNIGALTSNKDFQYHMGIQTNDNKILKMTDQMPVAIEFNNKSRVALVLESANVDIKDATDNQGISRKIENLSHKISLAYSNKQDVLINGETKGKYWLDLSQKNNEEKEYNSEKDVYDAEGLNITEEGPVNRVNNMWRGAGPYIAQFPSGETALSYADDKVNVRLGDENGNFIDDEGNFINNNMITTSKYGTWNSITLLSSHCMGLISAIGNYEKDAEGNNVLKSRNIEIKPMYLNHTVNANWHSDVDFANNEISWNKNTDALFIGSESQAQMTIQTAYDESNIYFLVNRLDNSLTDEDTVELYVNTNAENNDSSKIVLDKNGVREFNEDTNIANYGIKSSEYANDTQDENGGYQVLVAIPKEALGEIKESINVNAVLNNKDIGTDDVITDTFTNVNMDDTTTWNTVNLVKEELEIYALPTKTEYIQNYEELDLSGAKLKIQYNEEESEIIDITSDMVTGFDNSKIGTQTLTVTYRGLTTQFNIVINEKKLTNIEISTLPTKLEYMQNNEELDVTGGKIELQYNDTSKETIDMTTDMITGFDNTKTGKQTLTVTYEGKTTTYEVNILKKEVTKIELKTKPTKLEYIQNYDLLDVSGGVIEVKYNDGTTEEVNLTEDMVTGFDNSQPGTQTLTITYGGTTTIYEITVVERTVIDVTIKDIPTKVEYIQNYEGLDITGGTLEITYSDGATEEIAMTEEMVEGFDNSKLGTQTITVKYGEFTNTFEIDIVEKSIEKIKISKVPNKVEYIQNEEELNVEGGKLEITYNDKTTEEIDITEDMVTGFGNKTPGTIQLTVNYKGFTDTFNVTIKLKEIQNDHNENIDTTNKEEQDTTIANKVLPTTGLKSIIIISIILLATISVYMFYKVRKYKDVK